MAALEDQTTGIGEELPKIKEEKEESKTPGDEYLSNDHQSFQSQDPDELMNSDEGKEKEDLKPATTTAEDAPTGIEKQTSERPETHTLDATQQPPDLFTGTWQEEATSVRNPHEETDVYLATPDQKYADPPVIASHLKEDSGTASPVGSTDADLEGMSSQPSIAISHAEPKSTLQETNEIHMSSPAIPTTQDSQSTESSAASIQGIDNQGIDNQGQLYQQQPTYVLLQTTGEQDGSGQPQVFLAMQTGAVAGQDSQAYITLHPVSVEGQEISGAFSTEGLNLQQAVLTQSGITGDVSLELNPHVSLSDVKGLQLAGGVDSSSQMYIPANGQLVSASDNGDPSGSGVITYIQPSMTGGQTQVLMAVSEEDSPPGSNSVRIQAKEAAAVAGNLLGLPIPVQAQDASSPPPPRKQQQQQAVIASAQITRRRLSNDPRTCDECGRSFKYPSDLKKHLQIHTDMKKFQCEECCRCFRRLHQLNVHKRIHSGEKPYVCNRCGAEFRHDSTLTMHIRTRHDHLKPFSCDGCDKNFGRMSHLRKHQRNVCGKVASRGNIFGCKYCEEGFARKSDLRQHFLVCEKKPDKGEKDILGPTIFSCEHCGKDFHRNYDFKRHQLSHTDEKPFACSKCAKNFKEKSSLYKHVKRMHSMLTGDSILDSSQDESTETEAAQRAIATITSSQDAISASGSHSDIIVSLAHSMTSSSENDTIATAHALAQAGIIDNADQILQGSHTIAAADILNFPEVAAALGLNTGSQTGHPTMVVEQPGDAASMISMDTDHVRIADASLDRSIASDISAASAMKHFSNPVSLHLDSDGLIIDTNAGPMNPDEPMLELDHQEISAPVTSSDMPTISENIDSISSAATQQPIVSLPSLPVTSSHTLASDLMKSGLGAILSGADAERVASSVGRSSNVDVDESQTPSDDKLGLKEEEPKEEIQPAPIAAEEQETDVPMTIG